MAITIMSQVGVGRRIVELVAAAVVINSSPIVVPTSTSGGVELPLLPLPPLLLVSSITQAIQHSKKMCLRLVEVEHGRAK